MMPNTQDHPGKVLDRDYFQPNNLSIYRVAKETGISGKTICSMLTGRRLLSAQEAIVLARYFGKDDTFITDMQVRFELDHSSQELAAAA